MAEQTPPNHWRPDQSAAEARARTGDAAAAGAGGGTSTTTTRPRETDYPNPPEPGWWEGPRYPNPPDASNPDPATLREQWLFATRRYGRWYSRAWGAAILAGGALFALGWVVKGDNPLPSRSHRDDTAAGQK